MECFELADHQHQPAQLAAQDEQNQPHAADFFCHGLCAQNTVFKYYMIV